MSDSSFFNHPWRLIISWLADISGRFLEEDQRSAQVELGIASVNPQEVE